MEITPENEHFVDAIHPSDEQKYWVHYNWYWKDLSRQKSDIEASLICMDGTAVPIGFIVYGQFYEDEDLTQSVAGCYELTHLVIDKTYQQRGYGKQATLQAIQILKRKHDCRAILVAHHPDNTAARKLYEGLGFVETDRVNYDGDPLLKLNCR